jgi:alanine dehydrogenase
LPYAIQIAEKGWKKACIDSVPLQKGLNVVDGKVVYKGVADAFNLPYVEAETVL